MNSAARRDLVAEMVKACNERGLGFFAFYEYGFDWHHPHGPRRRDFKVGLTEVDYPLPESAYAHGAEYDLNRYIDYGHAQIEELLTRYGPIAGVWLDGVAVPLSGDKDKFPLPGALRQDPQAPAARAGGRSNSGSRTRRISTRRSGLNSNASRQAVQNLWNYASR